MRAGDSEDGIMSMAMRYLYQQIASGNTGATHSLKYGSDGLKVLRSSCFWVKILITHRPWDLKKNSVDICMHVTTLLYNLRFITMLSFHPMLLPQDCPLL